MPKTKVLILYTSVGYGIKATAQNIFEQLFASAEFEPRLEDIQKVESGKLTNGIEKIYLGMLDRFAFVWGFLYTSRLVLWLSLKCRKFAASFKYKETLNLLRGYQPAIVISTQTVATGIMAYLKSRGLYRGRLVAVFSDFHLHRFWLYDEVDLYVCAIAEQVNELKLLGIADNKIALTGMFIANKFNNQIPKEDAKRHIGLLQSMPTILLTSGARVRGEIKEIFLKLLRSAKSFQIVAVCGTNSELKEQLLSITSPNNHPVKILGYVENMEVLMSAADVLIGKTGGPTIGEAIIKKLPMIMTCVRPGHEVINLEYLVKNKIVEYARIPREAVFLAEQVLDGKLKKDWDEAFKKVIQPQRRTSLIQALEQIKPQTQGLNVRNYQNN